MRPINEIIIHCAATEEGRNFTVENIRRWHVQGNGWKDIGYHYLISLEGGIHQGRPIDQAGAHCKNHNQRTIGICYVGGLDDNKKPKDTRTLRQVAAIRQLVQSLKVCFPTIKKVSGHYMYDNKACPCFDVKKEFP